MQVSIRPMEVDDLQEVVGYRSLIYDQVSDERFKSVIFDDANYEKESTLVAVHDGMIVEFISSVAREGILGAGFGMTKSC